MLARSQARNDALKRRLNVVLMLAIGLQLVFITLIILNRGQVDCLQRQVDELKNQMSLNQAGISRVDNNFNGTELVLQRNRVDGVSRLRRTAHSTKGEFNETAVLGNDEILDRIDKMLKNLKGRMARRTRPSTG